MNILLGIVPFIGLTWLVRHMWRCILRDVVAKNCQEVFKFYPEGKLTEQQLEAMSNIIIERRHEYEAAKAEQDESETILEEGEIDALDILAEIARDKLNDTVMVAEQVCHLFSDQKQRDSIYFYQLAWPRTAFVLQ